MKNILVLINPVSGQNRFANTALNLARQSNANLLLCNGVETPIASNVSVYNTYWPEDDKYSELELLAEKLKKETSRATTQQPEIYCLDIDSINTGNIKQLVIDHEVSMIIMGVQHIADIYTPGYENPVMHIINNSHCPVLLIPEETQIDKFDNIAYLTDLRYCDLDVIKFLKNFNSKIFVTHISSNGIPDMEDNYAQTLLSDEIAAKTNYNKLFLRNIKRKNTRQDLEMVTATAAIRIFTIVNKKHQLLERFLSGIFNIPPRSYHQLPLLIVPYLDWHMA